MNIKRLRVLAAILMTGCVSLNATRAPVTAGDAICIIKNPEVREAFLEAYERQLRAKGYTTKVIAEPASCKITSTYTATYKFHWGLYLSTAELTISSSGREIGRAVYSAPYVSPLKHGEVEGKIQSMVEKLLP
jgi:hypothetical protein